jgi:hypothetical protein
MELYEVLPKIYNYVLVLANLWSYAKFMKTGLPYLALGFRV